jgi:hypothetical protein
MTSILSPEEADPPFSCPASAGAGSFGKSSSFGGEEDFRGERELLGGLPGAFWGRLSEGKLWSGDPGEPGGGAPGLMPDGLLRVFLPFCP